MRVYKLSKGWVIFIYVTAPLMIALFTLILIMPIIPAMQADMKPAVYWFLAPLSVAMIALMIAGIVDARKGKFVIDNDKVYTVGIFSNREFRFNEIKGFRVNDKYIFIESTDEHAKKMKISRYYGRSNEIIEWLAGHYPDLDIAQADQEREDILNNEQFGWTAEQRAEKLAKAYKVAKLLNWTGGLIGAWTLFLPKPYQYAIIASVVFPVVCVIVLRYFKGLVKVDERKDSAYPSIFWAIFASSMSLCLRAMFDFNIFDYDKIWAPSILTAAAFSAAATIGNKEFKFKKKKDYLALVCFSLFMVGYGYGAVITLNCIYDKSTPEAFNAKVLSKRISSGKTTTYYIALTPWGPQKELDEVSVSKDLYNRLQKSDTAVIYFSKGQFDIPWFVVTQ